MWSKLLVTTLVSGLVVGLVGGLYFGLVVGLVGGLISGLIGGLSFGLEAARRHYILRFWLWRSRFFPRQVVPFLEDATARVLLQRVGGGYSFTHPLLMDYFADLNTESLQGTTTIQTNSASGVDES